MSGVKYSPGATTHEIICDECGKLTSDAGKILNQEREYFGAAYLHAKQYAHKVRVLSTVSTVLSGYADSSTA